MTTTYTSATVLTAQIPTIGVAAAATANVTVVNPSPGGGTSNTAVFTVTASQAIPAISSISPTSATAGGANVTLTVNGSNFTSESSVVWNGQGLTTTFVNSSQLTAQLISKWTAFPGSANIVVLISGVGESGAALFTVNAANSAPLISAISPQVETVGGSAFTLTVLVAASLPVQWLR